MKNYKHCWEQVRIYLPSDWTKNDKPASKAWVGQWKPTLQPSAAPWTSGKIFTDSPLHWWQVYPFGLVDCTEPVECRHCGPGAHPPDEAYVGHDTKGREEGEEHSLEEELRDFHPGGDRRRGHGHYVWTFSIYAVAEGSWTFRTVPRIELCELFTRAIRTNESTGDQHTGPRQVSMD